MLIEALAEVEGPKMLFFVSEGVASFDEPDCTPIFERIQRAAQLSRVTIFPLQPVAFAYPGGMASASDGLRDLAGVTGGEYYHLIGKGDDEVAWIMRHTSGYYVLGFEATPAERDGRTHKIDLSTIRSDVTVRARPTFVISSDRAASEAQGSLSPPDSESVLVDARPHRELQMRLAAYTYGDVESDRVKVLAVMDSDLGTSRLSQATFGLFDPRGNEVARWSADGKDLEASRVVTLALARPGAYRLRAAAVDSAGRTGTVEYDFAAELAQAGPYEVSSLVLGVVDQATFVPHFEFGAEVTATAHLELYGTGATDTPTVRLAVSGPGGAALARSTAVVERSRQRGRWIASAEIEIASLPAGDYLVTATVLHGSEPVGSVTRILRKGAPVGAGIPHLPASTRFRW
jgi:hypothetical protein